MKLPALVGISFAILLLAGCSMAPGGKATPAATAVATPSAAATVAAPEVTASPASTLNPTSPASPTPSRTPEPPLPVPPSGFLASGITSVEGWTGSYCWQSICVDTDGIPPKAELPEITAGNGSLEFSLSDSATFTRWTVMYGVGGAKLGSHHPRSRRRAIRPGRSATIDAT